MLHRADTIQRLATDLDLQPGQAYTITAYRPGGIVSGTTSAGPSTGFFETTDIPLYSGHGFLVNDRFIIGIDPSTYNVITNVDGNTVRVLGTSSVTTGDTLVNLGADTGPSATNYDGSDIVIYSTPDTSVVVSQSRVTSNDEGEFDYYHDGTANLWELVRGTDGVSVAFLIGAYERPVDAASLEVDTLTVTGNETIGGTLAVTGATTLTTLATTGNSTFGDASTDTTTHIGRLIPRTITLDPTSNATAGTIGEVVYASTPNKFYGKHTTTATDTNWRLLGT